MLAMRHPTSSAAVSISRWTSRVSVPNLVSLNFFRTIAAGPGAGVKALEIEMRFDPPVAAVYFERGNKSEIRAFFYKGRSARGAPPLCRYTECFG